MSNWAMASCEGMMSMPPAPPRSSASPPSISQMLWLWRSPLTLMVKLAATEVGVLLSGSAELTPSPSATRAAKLRFSVAISLICSALISVLTTLESVWTARASASTVTVWVSAPTVSLTSTRSG